MLFDSNDTLAVVRTDGRGNVVRSHRAEGNSGTDLAESVDLAIAMIGNLASAKNLGGFQTAVLLYEEGTVFCGRFPSGEAIALVAAPGANLGLILNQVRRLVSGEMLGEVAEG